jgi:hypothetical protein
VVRRIAMDESKRMAVKFLEKEIKTYLALSLFLSKKDVEVLISPAFYQERMKEAKKIVTELKNSV